MPLSATALRTRRKLRSDGVRSFLSEAGTKALESAAMRAVVRRLIMRHGEILDQSQLRETAQRTFECDPPNANNPFEDEPAIARKRRLPTDGSFTGLDTAPPTAPFVAELHGVTVLGPSGLAITEDAHLIKDTVASNRSSTSRIEKALARSIRHNGYRKTRRFVESPAADCDQRTSVATTLVPVWANYYHWTLECLPKLLGVETYAERTGVSPTVLVPPELSSWMRESLDLVASNIKTEPLQPGTTCVDQFVVPSYPSPSRTECFWLQARAHEQAEISDMDASQYPSRIYVSRQNANVRRVATQDEMFEVLDQFDIQPYALETLSVREQVRLFSNADLIVSPHGAGLANLVYAQSPTVVELFGYKQKTTYHRLANLLGFEYHAMFCDHRRKDIVVPISEFEELIKSVIQGTQTPVLRGKN